MGTIDTVALVLAGNHREFDCWMKENKLHRQDFVYISKRQSLHGIHNKPVLLIGTYYKNPLYLFVMDYCLNYMGINYEE